MIAIPTTLMRKHIQTDIISVQVTEIVNVKAKIQTQIGPTLKPLLCLLSQSSHLFQFTYSHIYGD